MILLDKMSILFVLYIQKNNITKIKIKKTFMKYQYSIREEVYDDFKHLQDNVEKNIKHVF